MYGIYLDRTANKSITAQLCGQIRHKIICGNLEQGTRLPSSRQLAKELSVARNVVIDVYEQLIAEGYLEARTGSGTYVASGISVMGEDWTQFAAEDSHSSGASDLPPATIELADLNDPVIDFQTGTPDLRHFPQTLWGRYLKQAAEEAGCHQYGYGDSKGLRELRATIAAYWFRTRGMRCDPEQIVIVSGTSDGLMLIAHALRSQFRAVYVEDPTIEFAPRIFRQAGYKLKPVQVDNFGMAIHSFERLESDHLMLVTPSHQFPSGSILSIQRRQHAVRLAKEAGTYIIEDDYDSDFRLKGVPIPPLHSLDPDLVFYMGTFSKTLAPDLRLGFVVVPRHLIDTITNFRASLNLHTPSVPQLALARFIQDGRFDRHIYKMKGIYRNRRSKLISALDHYFGDRIEIRGDEAGMHLLVQFPEQLASIDWNESVRYGVRVYGVEEESIVKGRHHCQISLGYGTVKEEEMEIGIQRLYRFVNDFTGG